MDRRQAEQELARAQSLNAQMRGVARWSGPLVVGLGLLASGVTLVLGFVPFDAPTRPIGLVVVLFCLFAVVQYTYSRPAVPRHHLAVIMVLYSLGVAAFTVTLTVGSVVFPGVLPWWIPGAVLTGVPFFIAALVNRRATRPDPR